MKYPTFDELLPILKSSASTWVEGFEVDAENEDAVRYALAWSCAHPTFNGDPGKGLMLIGHKGTGKTILMRALGKCIQPDLRFTVVNTRKVTSAYNVDGDGGLVNYTSARNMLFDDLGDERTGQHYGDKVEVMALVIQDRYELFIDQGIMTHFTTNLSAPQLLERYGDRVYSRLKHMVNSVIVGSTENAVDRRLSAKAPKRKQVAEEVREPASEEVAAEGFQRVRDAIREAKKELEVQRPEVDRPTQQSDLAQFIAGIQEKSTEYLTEGRERIAKNNTEEAAKPFIMAIDHELKKREANNVAA